MKNKALDLALCILVEHLVLYSTCGNDNMICIICMTGKGNLTCGDGSEQILTITHHHIYGKCPVILLTAYFECLVSNVLEDLTTITSHIW